MDDNKLKGEIPIELIRLKSAGCKLKLRDNAALALPSKTLSELAPDLTKLELCDCGLVGARPCFARSAACFVS